MDVQTLISKLSLQPHPEGGYYRETYRNKERIEQTALPSRYTGRRCFSTAIYYLLTPDSCSRLHRVASDEVFHFYLGDPVNMLQLFPDGTSEVITFGQDIEAGQLVQHLVPKGVWQGSMLAPDGHFALLGATVAPGFDFADFEIGVGKELMESHPKRREMIEQLS